jgi:hypothetical protein
VGIGQAAELRAHAPLAKHQRWTETLTEANKNQDTDAADEPAWPEDQYCSNQEEVQPSDWPATGKTRPKLLARGNLVVTTSQRRKNGTDWCATKPEPGVKIYTRRTSGIPWRSEKPEAGEPKDQAGGALSGRTKNRWEPAARELKNKRAT